MYQRAFYPVQKIQSLRDMNIRRIGLSCRHYNLINLSHQIPSPIYVLRIVRYFPQFLDGGDSLLHHLDAAFFQGLHMLMVYSILQDLFRRSLLNNHLADLLVNIENLMDGDLPR